MKRVDLIGLMNAYGFELEQDDTAHCRMRFRNGNRFIDMWEGKRGQVMGVYNPETRKVWYRRRLTLSKVEDALLDASNQNQNATIL